MSLLDYLLYDQCRSSRFGPLGPHYDNMGGGLDRREDGGPAWNARAGQERQLVRQTAATERSNTVRERAGLPGIDIRMLHTTNRFTLTSQCKIC